MTYLEPHYRQVPPEALPPIERAPLHVVLDNIRSAFNVGSIFRTADACGVAQMHLCGMSAHPPHLKLAKTALGAQDYLPWEYYERTSGAIEALKAAGIPCVAIEATPDAPAHTAYSWPQPVAVVFGNEVHGVAPKTLARCDAVVRIPMRGYKNSLNVATAAGIVLFEIIRRWESTE